jgi:Tripartite tricarboxylate transporter family receptor
MGAEALPDVPAAADLVSGYEAGSWFGIGAPKATASSVIRQQTPLLSGPGFSARSMPRRYFFTAKTQTTPPCGTLFSTPMFWVTSASWMRCASTPQPDWMAIYCVPSTS